MRLFAILLAVSLCASSACAAVTLKTQAELTELTILEDFESLTLGSIDMQHVINEYGFDVELWNTQANKAERHDSTWGNVVDAVGIDGGQCVEFINRDMTGELDTVYSCFYLGYENLITDQGTIYMQYTTDNPNDMVVGFNDNIPGYESDVDGDPVGDDAVYQGTTNYSVQSALFRAGGGQEFRARHDGGYLNVDIGLQTNTWYEVWIQFDVSNKQTKYYTCEAGGTPTLVMNPSTSTEWWGWRDDTNTAVQNIKFFVGNQPIQTTILFDTIAMAQMFTTESPVITQELLPGDADHDCDVDIFDFLILKANYGTTSGATWEMGDFDGDGDVDIFDFLILKAHYGETCDD